MVGNIELRTGEIKYWIDELPNISLASNRFLNAKVVSSCQEKYQPRQIALEVYLHRNASNYGLLGIEYIPDSATDALRVEVNYCKQNEIQYADTILTNNDHVISRTPGRIFKIYKR